MKLLLEESAYRPDPPTNKEIKNSINPKNPSLIEEIFVLENPSEKFNQPPA